MTAIKQGERETFAKKILSSCTAETYVGNTGAIKKDIWAELLQSYKKVLERLNIVYLST